VCVSDHQVFCYYLTTSSTGSTGTRWKFKQILEYTGTVQVLPYGNSTGTVNVLVTVQRTKNLVKSEQIAQGPLQALHSMLL
jgi:hypothetical protein